MSFIEKFYNELKSCNVEILPPIYVNGGGKIGLYGTHQFTAGSDAYKELVDRCLEISPNKIQFVELILPTKAIDEALLLIRENVLLRYIKMRDIKTDELMERWDALIKAQ